MEDREELNDVKEEILEEIKEEITKEIKEKEPKKVRKKPKIVETEDSKGEKLEEIEEEVVGEVPIARELFSTSNNIELFIAHLQKQLMQQAQEIRMLKMLLTKTIQESQEKEETIDILAKSMDSASALAKMALDKLTGMMAYAIDSSIRLQDLAVRYAETTQTNVALTHLIDELRAKLIKYVPKEEYERLDELLSLLSKAYKIVPVKLLPKEGTKGGAK